MPQKRDVKEWDKVGRQVKDCQKNLGPQEHENEDRDQDDQANPEF